MHNYSILIDCPDSYSDILDIFLKYLNKNWSDCPAKIFITTNFYKIDNLKNIQFVKCGEGLNSIQRSAVALKEIKDEYILILDCDCFISKKVDNNEIDSIIKFAKDYGIKYVRVWKTKNKEQIKYPSSCDGFYFCNKKARYSKSLMANIWKKTEYEDVVVGTGLDGWKIESKWLDDTKTDSPGFSPTYCYYANDPLHILHSVYKGKWIRKAYRIIKKHFALTEQAKNRGTMSIKQTIKVNVSCFFKNHFSSKTINRIKKTIGNKHFEGDN